MSRFSACLAIAIGCAAASLHAADAEQFDLVIQHGRIVDGTGAPWYEADLGIRDGKIAAIGRLADAKARSVIDATGLIVAPGFIDMMGQTATPMLRDPATARNLLTQGITTINAGEGSSAAPLNASVAGEAGWQSMAEYFQMLDLRGLPVNVAQTVGHTQVRQIVMGDEDRRPTDDELAQMKEHVREAMEAGAIGLSTALIYPPAVYARTEEIADLAAIAGEYGGKYFTHMRNEGDKLLEAIDEALEIGAKAGAPVHIFHLKAAGRGNWDKMQAAIDRIRAAREQGQQVAADVYPYEFNGLGLEALIHPRHFAAGRSKFLGSLDDSQLRQEIRQEIEETDGWENWYRHAGSDWDNIIIGRSSSSTYAPLRGRSVAAIAEEMGADPWDVFFDLVRADAFALVKSMDEGNLKLAMKQDFISFCTDVGPAAQSSASHPRAFGAFPRVFARFVREEQVISLEQAVAKASGVAANELMAYDRGRIAVGLAADLALFDFDEIQDNATPRQPRKPADGVKHVLVGGVPVLKDGELTGSRAGRVLRGPGFKPQWRSSEVVSGVSGDGLEAFDELMRQHLRRHGAPGASLAITDQGRLVYAKGFGYADVSQREAVTPESLFRVASVSKPITAVAILQLVDAGKLKLETPVFDILDEYEPHLEEGKEFDARQKQITIEHLLQHRGGWDRDVSFDAMFQSVRFAKSMGSKAPASHRDIICCMLGLPLDFNPGERYAYSNYGYCLLGRVIEKLSGESYDDYVKRHVLGPVGVTQMTIGSTQLAGRRPGEVRYYDANIARSVFEENLGQRVPDAYGGWYLESMDSHGAWIASAVDLVKFASAFDKPLASPLLRAETVKTMFDRPAGLAGFDERGQPKAVYYGLGWQCVCDDQGNLRSVNHGGSLPGTSTKLVRRVDGRNFAVLFNARETPYTSRLADEITPAIERAISDVNQWPDIDLYDELGK